MVAFQWRGSRVHQGKVGSNSENGGVCMLSIVSANVNAQIMLAMGKVAQREGAG